MKLDILAFGAHPDDVEMGCGGTLLHQIKLGRSVGLVDLTRGELGTRGTPEIRKEEAAEAARLLGASVRVQLGLPDGLFVEDEMALKRIIHVIRQYQPEVIFANAIKDRHPDHGRGAQLVARACFLSGLRKLELEPEDGYELAEAWRPKTVYHYIQDMTLEPDIVQDITPYIDQKMDLMKAYVSQFFQKVSDDPDTPRSGANFMDYMKGKFRVLGRAARYDYAEGFNVSRTIGTQDIFMLE